jgi:hypothetical protein
MLTGRSLPVVFVLRTKLSLWDGVVPSPEPYLPIDSEGGRWGFGGT